MPNYHEMFIQAVLDADMCNHLEVVEYSSNPRFYITIENMMAHYETMGGDLGA